MRGNVVVNKRGKLWHYQRNDIRSNAEKNAGHTGKYRLGHLSLALNVSSLSCRIVCALCAGFIMAGR
jgi:hypothetical protein